MSEEPVKLPFARRSFLARLGAGLWRPLARRRSSPGHRPPAEATVRRIRRLPAARYHDQDDWLDRLPGKHRLVFDMTESPGRPRQRPA